MSRHRLGVAHRSKALFARDIRTSGGDEQAGRRRDSAAGDQLIPESAGELIDTGDEASQVRGSCAARGGLHDADSTLAAAVLVLKVIAVSIVLGLVVGIILGWGSVVVVEVK